MCVCLYLCLYLCTYVCVWGNLLLAPPFPQNQEKKKKKKKRRRRRHPQQSSVEQDSKEVRSVSITRDHCLLLRQTHWTHTHGQTQRHTDRQTVDHKSYLLSMALCSDVVIRVHGTVVVLVSSGFNSVQLTNQEILG